MVVVRRHILGVMMMSVIRNIAPSVDISYSSGLNGSDPKQMSE